MASKCSGPELFVDHQPMSAKAAHTPLAERLRPRSLSEVIGQQQVLGEGMALRVAFESGQPHSCILWGPPGVGKTTIARLMADAFDAQFLAISAVLGGVKEIQKSLDWAHQTDNEFEAKMKAIVSSMKEMTSRQDARASAYDALRGDLERKMAQMEIDMATLKADVQNYRPAVLPPQPPPPPPLRFHPMRAKTHALEHLRCMEYQSWQKRATGTWRPGRRN